MAGCDGAKTELMEAPKSTKKRVGLGGTKPPEYIVIPYLDGDEFCWRFFWNPPKKTQAIQVEGIGIKDSQENLSQHDHDLQW